MKTEGKRLRARFDAMREGLPPPGGTGISASEMQARLLARGYAVDRRTVQRDLAKLAGEGSAQSDGRKPAGWTRMARLAAPKLDARSDSVAVALTVLARHAAHLLPPSVLKELRPHLEQATRAFADRPQAPFARWAERIAVIPRSQPLIPPKVSPAVLETVLEALATERVLEIRHRKGGDTSEKDHRLHPAGLAARDGEFILVALYDGSDWPYQFGLHRISRAVITDDKARIPAGFRFQDYAASAEMGFGTGKRVRLQAAFDEGTGRVFEDVKLSTDQTCVMKTLKDGSVRYHVTATVEDSARLDWFLNSFGQGLIRRKKTVVGEAAFAPSKPRSGRAASG